MVAFSLLLVSLTVFGSYKTHFDIRFSFFYTLPIALTAWFVGRWAGVFFSFLCAFAWLGEVLVEHAFTPTDVRVACWNAGILIVFFLLLSILLSSLQEALGRERAAARGDALTRLANRRAFFELAEAEIQRAARYGGRFSVIYMDLDDFKRVNDRDGHQTGDRLLVLVADTLRKTLRANDIVARMGGDEFIILLPETGSEDTRAVFKKLGSRLADVMRRGRWPVTVSAGAVTFEKAPQSVDQLIKSVDELMYAAKTSGKNRLEMRIIGA